jgi:hypothetical protein
MGKKQENRETGKQETENGKRKTEQQGNGKLELIEVFFTYVGTFSFFYSVVMSTWYCSHGVF